MDLREFGSGVQKTAPLMLGVLPFGLAYGIMATQGGLTLAETGLMSLVVFAGSAQFMAAGMFQAGAGAFWIVFSTLLINLRHLLMGLSLAPYLAKQKSGRLFLLAFGMTDETYAATISHYQAMGLPDGSPGFMLGSNTGLYTAWFISSITGALLGHELSIHHIDPLTWGLDFAMPATFLSILIPQVCSLRVLAVVLASGACAVAAYQLIPGKWYIIIATVIATGLGTWLEIGGERRCSISD